MPLPRRLSCSALLLSLTSSLASAQSITSEAATATAIPVGQTGAFLLLAAGLGALGAWKLRHRARGCALALLTGAAVTLGTAALPELRAQVLAQFTNPSGETLPVPITAIPSDDDVAGFEPVDFTNASGSPLRIAGLQLPTLEECFPSGLNGALLPPGTPANGPTACGFGLILAPNDSCRVDVDAACRSVVAEGLALLSVTGSPLVLTANGLASDLTITNTSGTIAANNIASSFTGTALDGNVTETGNTCVLLPPGGSCTLTFTPGSTIVPATNFTLGGSNTNSLTTSIAIQSGSAITSVNPTSGTSSGGTGVTLTGTGLAGATGVSFDGVSATNFNVVDSTTVTAVTPAHAVGTIDVGISTPAGGATLSNGFTYLTTAIGQSASGGTIACLNGGGNNLIAATADNSTGIEWGGFGTAIGASAQSNTDGAANTAAIVTVLGAGNSYAAGLCNGYEIDSQGNTPCELGNTCYNDWFLPAAGQLSCLDTNRVAVGGFADAAYWTSTEFSSNPTSTAWARSFGTGTEFAGSKALLLRVRCVRAFTP